MTKSSEYIGQHQEVEPQDVINAALRTVLERALQERGTEVFGDIDNAPAEVRELIYAAMQD